MQTFELNFKPFGDRAIIIEWPSKIDEDILNDILRFKQSLNISLRKSVDILDVITAYNSVTLIHKSKVLAYEHKVDILKKIYNKSRSGKLESSAIFTIPVCYSSTLNKDQQFFLETKKLKQAQLIELHTSPVYRVYFLGFLPGFIYLGGLNKELYCPRKKLPSLDIAKGSVAIGGEQTGVYPQQSPGGWHVIGMSPIDFFDRNKSPACFAQAGDRIKFEAVSTERYKTIENEIQQGTYTIKRELWNA